MSCGQKAWAEELEQEAWEQTRKKFQSKLEYQTIQIIINTKDDLERLIESNPSLTKLQWFRLDNALKNLKELV